MDLPILRALAKPIFFLLALISSACLGDGCISNLILVTSPSNASILQGSNHTFLCKGNGFAFIIGWKINGTPTVGFPEDSNLKVVNVGVKAYNDGCMIQSTMIVHAKSAPGDNTLSTFVIHCVLRKTHFAPVVAEAYLKVHVIGGAGDVELISPSSPKGTAIIQWKAPDVVSGSSSPLYYNITVRDPSNQIIAQNTTTDTSFAIDSDLLVPCQSYELTLLPFQHNSSHTELGLMKQKTLLPPPLPPTNVNLRVSVGLNSAWVTIRFQAQPTNCSLQWPENFIVIVMQQGQNAEEVIESAEQTVTGMENEYTLENLDLRRKYLVSIRLQKKNSSSIAEIANFSTFNVQNLTLMEQEGGCKLNVSCDMAKGAEDKNCTVMMRNETGVLPWKCFPTGGRNATCKLSGLALGQYMIQGYDQGWGETPAVERQFLFTKELSEDLTNTAPTTRTDDTTTLEGSPSEDEEAVQNGLVVGIATPLSLVLTVVLVMVVVAVVINFCRKKTNTESAHTEGVCVYPIAKENEYDEHKIPQQQGSTTEPTVVQDPANADVKNPIGGNAYDEHNSPSQQNAVTEPTVVQEPTYADPHSVISKTPATNDSRNQYWENRKEWLAYLPHTTSFSL